MPEWVHTLLLCHNNHYVLPLFAFNKCGIFILLFLGQMTDNQFEALTLEDDIHSPQLMSPVECRIHREIIHLITNYVQIHELLSLSFRFVIGAVRWAHVHTNFINKDFHTSI